MNNLEKIELPSQAVAIVADPLLQKFMCLRPDAEAETRVSNWLLACVGDIASGDADGSLLLDVVEVMHSYVTGTRVCDVDIGF